jgi:hypothetical protein
MDRNLFSNSIEFLIKISSLVGLVSATVGVSYYFFLLHDRINKMEAQLQVVLSAPASSGSLGAEKAHDSADELHTSVSNPFIETCNSLAA